MKERGRGEKEKREGRKECDEGREGGWTLQFLRCGAPPVFATFVFDF